MVSGTIDGVSIGPVGRVNYRPLDGPEAGFAALLIDESPGGCSDDFTTGEHLLLTWCDPPPSMTLALHAPDTPDTCPNAFAGGLIEDASQQRDVAAAIDGEVTITRIDTSCVMGSFSGTFRDARGGTAMLGGSFAATVCPL